MDDPQSLDDPIVPSGQIVVPPRMGWAGAAPRMLGALKDKGTRRGVYVILGAAVVIVLAYVAHSDVTASGDANAAAVRADIAVINSTLGHMADRAETVGRRLSRMEDKLSIVHERGAIHSATIDGLRIRVDALASSVQRLDAALNSATWRARQEK